MENNPPISPVSRSYNPHHNDFYTHDVFPYPAPPPPRRGNSLRDRTIPGGGPPPPYAGAPPPGWGPLDVKRSDTLSSQLSGGSSALGDVDDLDYAPDQQQPNQQPHPQPRQKQKQQEKHLSRGSRHPPDDDRADPWVGTRWGPAGPPPDTLDPQTQFRFLRGELRYVDHRGSDEGAHAKRDYVLRTGPLVVLMLIVGAYTVLYSVILKADGMQYLFTIAGILWLIQGTLYAFSVYAARSWNPLEIDDAGESPPIAYWPIKLAFYGNILVGSVAVLEILFAVLTNPDDTNDPRSLNLAAGLLHTAIGIGIVLAGLAVLIPRWWDKMMRYNTDGFEVAEAERGDFDDDASAEWQGQLGEKFEKV